MRLKPNASTGYAIRPGISGSEASCGNAIVYAQKSPADMMTPNFATRYPPKTGVRGKYLLEERERIRLALSLAETFPQLKSLAAQLSYFAPLGRTPQSEVKCTFNLGYAKALFRFACPNNECVGGNFDLSAALARAVAEQQVTLNGEVRCEGWQSKATIDRVSCHHVLRYQLTLEY
jgi:hypothetical protein